MKFKKIILSCLLMMGLVSASAQDQQAKTEYVFQPHWYVQVQPVGAQYTLGELSSADLISYNAQIGLGYNFNSVVGARLAVDAWQSKAGSKYQANKFAWDWKYVAPALDVTFNISNLVAGFNPKRFFNFSVFAGVGVNYAFDNDKAKEAKAEIESKITYLSNQAPLEYLWKDSKVLVFGQAGVQADFRLSDKVSLGVEVNANTLNDHYNSKKAGNADWYFNALAGLKINLGKTYTTKTIPAPEPEIRYVEKVVEKVVEVPAAVPAPTALRRDVFFTINSTVITEAEAVKVKEIADFLGKNPAARVVVTGYADAGTGNDRINDRLAAQRADVVVKALKEQYGIAADRITYDSRGARVQPFAENDKNRVSICIAQ